jgi:hypothetical protein
VLSLRTARGTLAAGQEVRLLSSDLLFTNAAGSAECPDTVILGEVLTNNTARPTATLSTATSTGEGIVNYCETTTPLGPAQLLYSGLPWTLSLAATNSSPDGRVTRQGRPGHRPRALRNGWRRDVPVHRSPPGRHIHPRWPARTHGHKPASQARQESEQPRMPSGSSPLRALHRVLTRTTNRNSRRIARRLPACARR